MLTIYAITHRFGSETSSSGIPIPRAQNLPIFSDNVIPSMLVHLGIIDLTTSTPSLGLAGIFPNAQKPESLAALLGPAPVPESPDNPENATVKPKLKLTPEEGPELTVEQAYILRAAAIDACELIVEKAHQLAAEAGDRAWYQEITLPELDAWLWAGGKDRIDYRKLERFALKGTTYF